MNLTGSPRFLMKLINYKVGYNKTFDLLVFIINFVFFECYSADAILCYVFFYYYCNHYYSTY